MDRFDIDLAVDGKYDIYKIDNFMIYGAGGIWARVLMSEGSQNIIGFGAGIGTTY